MPQKKTVKRNKQKKPAMKRQTQKNVLALAEKVEKEFRLIPKKLASIYRQELMNQKKQEAKWKIEFKKAEKAQKLSQQKQAALTKNPSSKSNTKQLALAKKSK